MSEQVIQHKVKTLSLEGDRALCSCWHWHPLKEDGEMDTSRNLDEESPYSADLPFGPFWHPDLGNSW